MNNEFIVKMIQAKQLEYEAIKAVLPEPMKRSLVNMEGQLLQLAKECFTAMMFEGNSGFCKEESGAAEGTKQEQRVRRVNIQ